MPYELTREPKGIHKRFWGAVTPDEFVATVRELHNDPNIQSYLYSINDFTDVTSFEIPGTVLDDVAAIHIGSTKTNPRLRIIGISTNPALIALARQYDQLSGIAPFLIYPTLGEARQWIRENC